MSYDKAFQIMNLTIDMSRIGRDERGGVDVKAFENKRLLVLLDKYFKHMLEAEGRNDNFAFLIGMSFMASAAFEALAARSDSHNADMLLECLKSDIAKREKKI